MANNDFSEKQPLTAKSPEMPKETAAADKGRVLEDGALNGVAGGIGLPSFGRCTKCGKPADKCTCK